MDIQYIYERRLMRRFILTLSVSIFSFSAPVMAGFEWLPPSQNPAPTQARASQTLNAPVAQNQNTQTRRAAAPLAQGQSKTGGLFIDPYPLQNGNNSAIEINPTSINQAIIEEAEILHPLKLGAGLKTGAQPIPAPRSNFSGGSQASSQVGIPNNNFVAREPIGDLTPFVGGEPAALATIENVPRSPRAATPTAPRQYAKAVGFGKDLPLALALSQVIPRDYTHSFADGVDAGATVSWEGGKPWNDVLEDMLNARNLTATIQGNQVVIRPLARL